MNQPVNHVPVAQNVAQPAQVFTTGQQQQQVVYPIGQPQYSQPQYGQPQYGQPQTNYIQPTMVQPTVITYNQGTVYLGHVPTISNCQFCKTQVKN
jgi:hypothetical protein